MNEIIEALELARDSTYADAMTENAKEYLRNELNKAIEEVKNKITLHKKSITISELYAIMQMTESLMENEMNGTGLQILNERVYKIKRMITKQYNEIIEEINIK